MAQNKPDCYKEYDMLSPVVNKFINDRGNVAGEIVGENVYSYVRGNGLVSYNDGTNIGMYTTNLHGDVSQIIAYGQKSLAKYGFDAFGNENSAANTVHNPFGYCGEYRDEETGLIYLRARYYDTESGRFISEDPAKDGTNWYSYCYNNPVMFVDLGGLKPRSYEPEKWNNDDVQMRTNCYAYAMDWCGVVEYGNLAGNELKDGTDYGEEFAAQPGFLRSHSNTLLNRIFESNENNHRISAIAGALLDATNNGHTFRLATEENIKGNDLGEHEWVVYLVTNSGGSDYHWYRQNAGADGKFDGTWSHKPGGTPATNRELIEVHHRNGTTTYEYGNVITDPTAISRTTTTYRYNTDGTINWGDSETNTYDVVVGAYVVVYQERR